MQAFKTNISRFLDRRPRPPGLVGINIGMNKGQTEPAKDYRLLVRNLGSLADYMTVNISSPNTPGLRDLQRRENLLPLLAEIVEERTRSCGAAFPPVLVKLAPDLDARQQEDISAILLESGIDGPSFNQYDVGPASRPASRFRRPQGWAERLAAA